MSNYDCYYVGPYVKVYPPKKEYTRSRRTCINNECSDHGKHLPYNPFCAKCGHAIDLCDVHSVEPESMYDFLNDELEEDLFTVVNIDHKKYQIFISNSNGQGGTHTEDYGDYPIADDTSCFDKGDWATLIAKLEDKSYNFEKKIGLVSYYN